VNRGHEGSIGNPLRTKHFPPLPQSMITPQYYEKLPILVIGPGQKFLTRVGSGQLFVARVRSAIYGLGLTLENFP